ncbi:MAG: hypothetical protein ACR2M3_14545 [Thermomicrobiales bacterium]
MNMASSTGYSAAVATSPSFGRGLIRWAVLGAAGVIALILALSHSMTASAQVPTTNCIPISYGNCVTTGVPFTNVGSTYIPTNTGIPANAAASAPYFDPRYGLVQVVTDSSGNLIDINPQTGQRIYPVFPDYGIGGVIGNGFIGANFNNGFVNNGFVNGFNGFNSGFVNGFNGFNGGFFNGNTFPAGATNVGGGVFTYNDNRFCGDGKIAFVVGRGYFCQNGGPLVTNNTVTTVNCGNFFLNGCGIYRPFEVNASTPQQASTVTAYAATAAPKAAAPVVQAAVPVTQAAAPVVQAAVAPKAPVMAPAMAAPIVAKAQATTPAATSTSAEPDDHRG